MSALPKTLFTVPTEGPGLLKVDEVRQTLNIVRETIVAGCDSGDLEAHRQPGEKAQRRITRRSLIAFQAKAISDVEISEEMLEAVIYLARTLTPARRRAFVERLLKEAAR